MEIFDFSEKKQNESNTSVVRASNFGRFSLNAVTATVVVVGDESWTKQMLKDLFSIERESVQLPVHE
jgi:hypothetical protein